MQSSKWYTCRKSVINKIITTQIILFLLWTEWVVTVKTYYNYILSCHGEIFPYYLISKFTLPRRSRYTQYGRQVTSKSYRSYKTMALAGIPIYCNLFLQFVGVDDDVQIEAKVWLATFVKFSSNLAGASRRGMSGGSIWGVISLSMYCVTMMEGRRVVCGSSKEIW